MYGHTHPDFPDDPTKWEPLFTPFGDEEYQCRGIHCAKCRQLVPKHGHVNKVAFWCAKFAAEMIPPGEERDAARQWGYLAGLWHDLGKFATEAFMSPDKTKSRPANQPTIPHLEQAFDSYISNLTATANKTNPTLVNPARTCLANSPLQT